MSTQYPFDRTGTEVGDDGIRRYTDLPEDVVQMLRHTVDRFGDRTAVVEVGGPSATYAELWSRAARVAGGLCAAGVAPGDRVAVHLGNGLDWLLAYWGTLLAGGIVVPVNTRLAEAEVAFVLEDCGARYVVRPGEPLPDGEPVQAHRAAHRDVASLFYTSGTTGRPKGAMNTHENLLSNVESSIRCSRLVRDGSAHSVALVSVPLFHVTGCNSQMLTQLAIGGTVVVLPRLDLPALIDAVSRYRVTMMTTVPTIWELTLRHPDLAGADLSSLRTVNYGGAPIAPELVHRLRAVFPTARLGNGFGMSEAAALITFLPDEYSHDHPDSVGFPIPVVDVRVEHPDPVSGVGELLVRGQNVAAGYWGDPARTAETFVDGWLHTGDLARIDDGMVRIVDRVKDMINRGGENVYCVEVENALAAHPDVVEVAVVGVADPVMGEKVGAVVQPRPGVGAEELVPSLIAHARGLLADYKVPQFVRVLDVPLPRNASGKVLKRPLRATTGWTEVPRAPR
ncbi:AMP-binding protein [Modestobacter sp. I12A-02628]|uniref:Long-chain fatty acid--CoA ligase n=1 Tax=Goekera deserti TaxID=2497753 RepID=A0A7K3WGH3_9ACTN|nr:AMP-binding protein [Goekera deserti]MPQ96568.1 AMP-binding protein [Goekera deserti]NDI47120.1 AMP-binding protein [Goekera deserti]NEL55482.1 long-chain fatty acid--CoA ligase [Goekera deserti]